MTLIAEWRKIYPRWQVALAAVDELLEVLQQWRDTDGILEVFDFHSWLLCTPMEDLVSDQAQEQLQKVEEGISRIARQLHQRQKLQMLSPSPDEFLGAKHMKFWARWVYPA